jgi:hypothetical protein
VSAARKNGDRVDEQRKLKEASGGGNLRTRGDATRRGGATVPRGTWLAGDILASCLAWYAPAADSPHRLFAAPPSTSGSAWSSGGSRQKSSSPFEELPNPRLKLEYLTNE